MDFKYFIFKWLALLLIGLSVASCLSLNKFRRSQVNKLQLIQRYLDIYANELLNFENIHAHRVDRVSICRSNMSIQ